MVIVIISQSFDLLWEYMQWNYYNSSWCWYLIWFYLDGFVKRNKIYRYLWDVFLMLWTLLGLGRDIRGVIYNLPLDLYDEIYIYIYIYIWSTLLLFLKGVLKYVYFLMFSCFETTKTKSIKGKRKFNHTCNWEYKNKCVTILFQLN